MSDPLEYLDRLAARARQEPMPPVPGFDGRIPVRGEHHARSGVRAPFLVFSSGYVALAAVAGAAGIVLLNTLNDPLSGFFYLANAAML
ncbi:MAG: hypothetical protein JXR94_10240 [Candidatus Hydrogenedentes bacterium]|nr:hypothetical protein [Candidatus Hydrogenedentota bacterium]